MGECTIPNCPRCVRGMKDLITPQPDRTKQNEKDTRIGKLFRELWEMGAPWPVARDKKEQG